MTPINDINRYLKSALRHGESSEPDHEVGDLQSLLEAAWSLMTHEQKEKFHQLGAAHKVLVAGGLKDGEAPNAISAYGHWQPARPHLVTAADHRLETGDHARDLFMVCLNSAMQDDATGSIYGIKTGDEGTAPAIDGLNPENLTSWELPDFCRYDMIVIDSGNTHADSWKCTLYPKSAVAVLAIE